MNYLAIVQRLHSESLRSTAAPSSVVGASAINGRLFNRVADKWRDLQAERDWRWMRGSLDATLVIGQQTYTATGLGATRFGRWRPEDREYRAQTYISGSPNALWMLNFRQLDEFRQQWVYRDMGNSQPLEWTIDESDQLLIGPAPSVAYKLRIDYWKEPSELVDDTDEPDLPDRFHMLLCWAALIDVATADAKPELVALAERNYTSMHNRLMADQARRPHL